MIIKNDQEMIKGYLEDASGFISGSADLLVIPENEQDIINYLQQASASNTPVTIAGGRTGVAAGCIPTGGTILSLEKLDSLDPIQQNGFNYSITVGPAVRLETLKSLAAENNLIYGPDPTERTGTLGGNAATNASGGQCFKYGPTRDHILGLRMVLTTGDVIDIKRGEIQAQGDDLTIPFSNCNSALHFKRPDLPPLKVYKNAAGYFSEPDMDALDLLIGMDGTLGVITSLTVKLLSAPQGLFSLVIFLSDIYQAAKLADTIRQSARQQKSIIGISPASLELMDGHALDLLRPAFTNIPAQAGAVLIIEQDFSDPEDAALQSWADFLEQKEIAENMIWLAEDKNSREQIRKFRHALPETVNTIVRKRQLPKVGTDMAVPVSAFSEMLQIYIKGLKNLGQDFLIFGHIGDCHLHVNVLPKSTDEFKQAKTLYLQFAREAVRHGGTVSAEHGIGKIKHDFLKIMVNKYGLKEMSRIKKVFDPALILNRGNIFPESLLPEK